MKRPSGSDITMCANKQCERRKSCVRFMAKPNKHWQTYSKFEKDECGYYIEMPKPLNCAVRPLKKGLCYRCEYRAQFHENGHAPRYECGTGTSYMSCYMYRPVSPIILKPRKGEKRSVLLPAIMRGRSEGIGVADCKTVFQKLSGGRYLLTAEPITYTGRRKHEKK